MATLRTAVRVGGGGWEGAVGGWGVGGRGWVGAAYTYICKIYMCCCFASSVLSRACPPRPTQYITRARRVPMFYTYEGPVLETFLQRRGLSGRQGAPWKLELERYRSIPFA